MSTASAAKPPNKRVRIDTDNNPVYDYTPIAGSVSTLLPAMRELVQHYYDKFIKTCRSIYDKKNIIKKLSKPDFIPRSAKSNFQLGASETVKQSTEYNDLAKSVDEAKTAFEKKQKQHIIQSAKLEVEVMVKQRKLIFIEGIFKITGMIYLWKTDNDEINEGEVHYIIKDLIERDSVILLHSFNNDRTDFITNYNIIYPLAANIITLNNDDDDIDIDEVPAIAVHNTLDQYFPRANNTQANNQLLSTQDSTTVTTAGLTASTTQDSVSQNDTTDDTENLQYEVLQINHPLLESEVLRLLRILRDVFVASWTNEQKKIENKQLEVKMARFAKMNLISNATDEAAAIVANEPAANMVQLNELIEKKVEEKTKKITKELQSALQQLKRTQNTSTSNQKNLNRGETSTRANANKSKRQQAVRTQENTNNKSNSTTRNNKQSPRNTRGRTNNRGNQQQNNDKNPRRKNRSRSRTPNTRNTNNKNPIQGSARKRNGRNNRSEKADGAEHDTSARNANNKQKNNKKRSSSRSRSTSTKRGRPRNLQK
jgi:hypothetical protein